MTSAALRCPYTLSPFLTVFNQHRCRAHGGRCTDQSTLVTTPLPTRGPRGPGTPRPCSGHSNCRAAPGRTLCCLISCPWLPQNQRRTGRKGAERTVQGDTELGSSGDPDSDSLQAPGPASACCRWITSSLGAWLEGPQDPFSVHLHFREPRGFGTVTVTWVQPGLAWQGGWHHGLTACAPP